MACSSSACNKTVIIYKDQNVSFIADVFFLNCAHMSVQITMVMSFVKFILSINIEHLLVFQNIESIKVHRSKMSAPIKFYYDLLSQPSRALYIFLKLTKIPVDEHPVALRKGKFVL